MKTFFSALALLFLTASAYSQYDLITASDLYDGAKALAEKYNGGEASLIRVEALREYSQPDSLNPNEMEPQLFGIMSSTCPRQMFSHIYALCE